MEEAQEYNPSPKYCEPLVSCVIPIFYLVHKDKGALLPILASFAGGGGGGMSHLTVLLGLCDK